MSSHRVAYAMMMLGVTCTCSGAVTLIMLGYCFLCWTFPSVGMLLFFAWTVGLTIATWKLDSHLVKKETKKS